MGFEHFEPKNGRNTPLLNYPVSFAKYKSNWQIGMAKLQTTCLLTIRMSQLTVLLVQITNCIPFFWPDGIVRP